VEERQATVRGVPVRWTEAGEGFPVVLVHGIPTSPVLWRRVLPQVRGGRCLAVEMVGGATLSATEHSRAPSRGGRVLMRR
jgi:pimeloyl-ACP methyl ester carboxylesterase